MFSALITVTFSGKLNTEIRAEGFELLGEFASRREKKKKKGKRGIYSELNRAGVGGFGD